VRLLRRNLISTYAAYAASIVSGLIVTPIVVHALGKEQFGLWVFIGSMTVFLGLLDVGVGPAVVRFAAFEHGRGGDVGGLASAALSVYAVLAVVTAALSVGLAWLVPELIDVRDDLVWPARLATLLVAGGILLRFPFGLAQSLLAARQRFDVLNVGNAISLALYTALVAVLIRGNHGEIVLLAGLALGAALVRFLIPVPWVPREFPGFRLSRSLVTRERMHELLAFSWYGLLIQIAAKIVTSTDVIVVGVVLGAEPAALYGIASRLFGLGLGLGTAGTRMLFPAFSELEGRDDRERQHELLLAGLRVGMALMLFVALPLVLVPDLIIRAWVGGGFEESTWVLVLLGLSLIVHQPANVLSQYLSARARQRELSFVSLSVVAVNLTLSIVLAFTVGLWGVALASAVTLAVETVLFVPRLVVRAGGPQPTAVARASLRPVLPALVAAGLVLGAGGRLVAPDDIPGVALLGAVWLAAALPTIWFLGLSPGERRAIRARLLPESVPYDVPA
jgi:O-antigen/teichoic acid export membrane protein